MDPYEPPHEAAPRPRIREGLFAAFVILFTPAGVAFATALAVAVWLGAIDRFWPKSGEIAQAIARVAFFGAPTLLLATALYWLVKRWKRARWTERYVIGWTLLAMATWSLLSGYCATFADGNWHL